MEIRQRPIRKIAVNTGGGDAPGLNAVIRAVVLSAEQRGWECAGIRDGYNGLLFPERFGGEGLLPLTHRAVRGITHLGGTILGTTNKGDPTRYPVLQPDGSIVETDLTDTLLEAMQREEFDALIAIGGDGSLSIANVLSKKGFRVIGVPKTIDNDLDRTDVTFGFNSAVAFTTECLDRLHSTAEAHERVIVVEVMGRYAGWIALDGGVAGTADVILIPEIPYDIDKVADKIMRREKLEGRRFAIVVVAEGAMPKGGSVSVLSHEAGRAERLGGAGEQVAGQIEKLTGKETRTVVLGHLLRGGSPTTLDRLISLRFGSAAVRALAEGMSGVMVALNPPQVNYVPLEEATSRMKRVPLDGDTIRTARELGISFGD